MDIGIIFKNMEVYQALISGVVIWLFFILYFRILIMNKRTRIILGSLLLVQLLAISFIIFRLFAEFLQIPITIIVFILLPVVASFIIIDDIKEFIEQILKFNIADKKKILMGSNKTKESIIDAVMQLSLTKTGALITIEKQVSLDFFVQKAISLQSEVSKELLLNIFVPKTPLHDGGVIIRGDKILCAGAYYHLSSNDSFDKTTGSRHRAGLGVSEESDSVTIIVSEETGDISLAYEGILVKIYDREKLLEYLNTVMK